MHGAAQAEMFAHGAAHLKQGILLQKLTGVRGHFRPSAEIRIEPVTIGISRLNLCACVRMQLRQCADGM
jgi:hypothetical protein